MLSILWALGSMLILLLIISFLPLGYTFKVKFLVVFTSFIISLAGLSAIPVLPFWETALILFALSFFGAYLLVKRLGKNLYHTTIGYIDEVEEKAEYSFSSNDIEEENDYLETKEKETPVTVLNSPEILVETEDVIETEIKIPVAEDLSFVLEREGESLTLDETEEKESDNNYLIDLEDLLENEAKTEMQTEIEQFDDLLDLPVLPDATGASLEELIQAAEEAAVSRDSQHEEKKTEKVSLEK